MRTFIGCFLIAGFMVLMVAGEVMASDDYLCVAEKATGFKFIDERWSSYNVDVDKERYIIKEEAKPTELFGKIITHTVKQVGQDTMRHCTGGDSSLGFIQCGGLLDGLLLNTQTLRFHQLSGYGFIDDDKGFVPFLAIGKCTKLEARNSGR